SGSAVGPLLAALIIIPNGQASSAWLMLFAAFGIFVLFKVSRWTITNSQTQLKKMGATAASKLHGITLIRALGVIGILMIAKFTYTVS
ncbi:MFS transporter, partial [Acinetobacter variabilis]